MTLRKTLIVAAVVVAVAVTVLALRKYYGPHPSGAPVDITLVNESNRTVTDIHLTHPYEAIACIPQLESGERVERTLYPSGGSNLRISYFQGRRHLHVAELDVYVGSMMRRETVIIRIQDDGVVATDLSEGMTTTGQ